MSGGNLGQGQDFFPIIGVRILQDYQQGDDIKKDSRMQHSVCDL